MFQAQRVEQVEILNAEDAMVTRAVGIGNCVEQPANRG